jgi:hypothetical protein
MVAYRRLKILLESAPLVSAEVEETECPLHGDEPRSRSWRAPQQLPTEPRGGRRSPVSVEG